MKRFFIKNKYLQKKSQRGFALLFTVVVVSAISVITAGITNAIYKQMVLSSLVKDSSSAFYQADTASECALYADLMKVSVPNSKFFTDEIGIPFVCGGQTLEKFLTNADPLGSYSLLSQIPTDATPDNDSNPCFNIEVSKTGDPVETTVRAKGYNFCDKTNPRTVEREIQIQY